MRRIRDAMCQDMLTQDERWVDECYWKSKDSIENIVASRFQKSSVYAGVLCFCAGLEPPKWLSKVQSVNTETLANQGEERTMGLIDDVPNCYDGAFMDAIPPTFWHSFPGQSLLPLESRRFSCTGGWFGRLSGSCEGRDEGEPHRMGLFRRF